MSENKIILVIRSSEGFKPLKISPTDSGTTLKTKIKTLLNTEEDFVAKCGKNGRPGEEIKFMGTSTISSLK